MLAYVSQFAAPLWIDKLIQMHRTGGPQGWSEHLAHAENLSPIAQSISVYPYHYTDCAIWLPGWREREQSGDEFQSFNLQACVVWNFYSLFQFMRRFVLSQLSVVLFKNNDAFIVKDTDQCFIQVTIVVLK